jgi:2,4-dienoyl-CoA reductase-like NADH-dependent reductase (Old Yellow Enzyme family)
MDPLTKPLRLPCGVTVPNRIAKAAMTEGLANERDQATRRHETLYGAWSDGGAGLLLTGNVMIDERYLERPGNVVIDDHEDREALARWAAAGTRGGNQLWMQINHPGRQCTRMSSGTPVAPSAVAMKNMLGLFAQPRALREDEILDIIERWARVATIAKESGFTGVQVHSAHGYLSSQFLSPRVNLRTDRWGGSLENRARLLLQTVEAVRASVGPHFPVSVKLNSADFQQGGFSNEDAAEVARWLHELRIDLLEISGGNYEQMALFGELTESGRPNNDAKSESTQRREAYFLEYAQLIRAAAPDLPLMVTGGFRTAEVMRDALEANLLDVVGIARPFCVLPDLAHQLLHGHLAELPQHERDQKLGNGWLGRTSRFKPVRVLNGQAEVAWFYRQIIKLSEGQRADTSLGTWAALTAHFRDELRLATARRRQHQANG